MFLCLRVCLMEGRLLGVIGRSPQPPPGEAGSLIGPHPTTKLAVSHHLLSSQTAHTTADSSLFSVSPCSFLFLCKQRLPALIGAHPTRQRVPHSHQLSSLQLIPPNMFLQSVQNLINNILWAVRTIERKSGVRESLEPLSFLSPIAFWASNRPGFSLF